MPNDTPLISVVICTRNRAAALEHALGSLEADASTVPAEVLVVDNASRDQTSAVVRCAASRSRRSVTLLSEPQLGQCAARNCGVRAALGEWIVFTDDDVGIRSGWLDALADAFDSSVDVVGGRVVPHFLGERPDWLEGFFNPVTLADYGERKRDLDMSSFPIGANMAIRTSLLHGLLPEPFDTRLGHVGGVAMGFDEVHVLHKLARAGSRMVYAPDAIVEHRIEPSRATYEALRRSFFHSGFGMGRHERFRGDPMPSFPRRVVRAARLVRSARQIRSANAAAPAIDATSAEREFWAFAWAAKHIEQALERLPRLAEYVAVRGL